jgi:hypothetical protein
MLFRRSLPLVALLLAGCGTTRSTDTARAATEMLLVSQAVDKAVAGLDFTPLAGKTVFLDAENVDKATVDRGYLVSSVRQQLLASGALLRETPKDAVYVVELRTGGLGTDRHSMLVGTPAVQVPAVVPGLPTNIPELALFKKSDQRGVAKLAVFAYNRVTGRAVWQSGLVEETSTLKDRWILGSGPYSDGTIKPRTEFAGQALPAIPHVTAPSHPDDAGAAARAGRPADPGQPVRWANADAPVPPQPVPVALVGLAGGAAAGQHQLLR